MILSCRLRLAASANTKTRKLSADAAGSSRKCVHVFRQIRTRAAGLIEGGERGGEHVNWNRVEWRYRAG
jgi:hypothetical protein